MSLGKKIARWILGAAVAAAMPALLTSSAKAQVAGVAEVGLAQTNLDQAQFQVDRALQDVDTARAGLAAARQKAAAMDNGATPADAAAREAATKQLADAEQRLKAAVDMRNKVAADRDAVAKAGEGVRARHDQVAGELEQIRRQAMAGFEMSEPYMKAKSSVETAQRDVALAEQNAIDALATTEEYRKVETLLRPRKPPPTPRRGWKQPARFSSNLIPA
jgi:hypothetical protein